MKPLLQDIYKVSFKKDSSTLQESVEEFSSQLFDLYCEALEDIGAEDVNDMLKVTYRTDIGKEHHLNTLAGVHALDLIFRKHEYKELNKYEKIFVAHALKYLKDKEAAEQLMILIENIAEEELVHSLDYQELKEATAGVIERIKSLFEIQESF